MVTVSAEQRTAVLGPGLSTFVGRERELEALTELLGRARLVTLVGPGGSGKTRLALEAADGHVARADNEVVVVELAALRDPALVPAVIAEALGLRASGSEAPLELLVRHIGGTDRLLLLDNLEQLLPAAAETLAELLRHCPGLRLLVTSRVPLNLRAEHVVRVEPLPVPGTDADPEGLADVPSVALFTERARASGAELVIDGAEAPNIGAICRRLDGLPLALELAAARLRLLSPTALLARLEQGLGVLAAGPLDAEERHRTLRDTIAWSVALLPPREAALFGRLGVFRGGFDLAAAYAVAGLGIVDSEDELLERLGALVDHSLLRVIPGPEAEPRFGMLETIREYAREHLEDEQELRDRHLAHYLALAEQTGGALIGPGHAAAARRVGADIENVRAALSWAEASGGQTELLRLAAALGLYWRLHGDIREGRDRLERAIALAPPGDPALAPALLGLGRIAFKLGDRRLGRVLAGQALEFASTEGDQRGAGEALCLLGIDATYDSESDAAPTLLEQSLAAARASGDMVVASECLGTLGNDAWYRGDRDRALRLYEEAMAMARQVADPIGMGILQLNLGSLLVLLFEDARNGLPHLRSGLEMLQETDVQYLLGWANLFVSQAQIRLGQLEQARQDAREGLRLVSRTASPDDLIQALEVMADWLGTVGAGEAALKAWAADERAREDLGSSVSPGERAWIDPLVARDRRAAGEPGASLAWAQGAGMDLEAALSAALRAMDAVDLAHHPNRPLDPRGASLTAREVEVLALVGEGCSDGQIAERLFISKKTASVHVANIKDKLATGNRVETALAAVRMSLVPPTAPD